jgi:hypothetical protein
MAAGGQAATGDWWSSGAAPASCCVVAEGEQGEQGLEFVDAAGESYSLPGIDTTGNGRADVVAMDANQDGVVDTWMYDTTGSGDADLIYYDSDGDGQPDSVSFERSGGGGDWADPLPLTTALNAWAPATQPGDPSLIVQQPLTPELAQTLQQPTPGLTLVIEPELANTAYTGPDLTALAQQPQPEPVTFIISGDPSGVFTSPSPEVQSLAQDYQGVTFNITPGPAFSPAAVQLGPPDDPFWSGDPQAWVQSIPEGDGQALDFSGSRNLWAGILATPTTVVSPSGYQVPNVLTGTMGYQPQGSIGVYSSPQRP